MPRSSRRRITLLDLMALIAATAAGLAPLRLAPEVRSAIAAMIPGPFTRLAFQAKLAATPLLACWSLALLALGLVGSRAPRRRLARRPGFLLNLAAVAGLIYAGAIQAVDTLARSGSIAGSFIDVAGTTIPQCGGMVVVGALLPLELGRRCRPEPTWLDRLSWTVGIIWVVLVPFTWFCHYLMIRD